MEEMGWKRNKKKTDERKKMESRKRRNKQKQNKTKKKPTQINTRTHGQICTFLKKYIYIFLLPSMTKKSWSGVMMPALRAMARAVIMLSPVTMRTMTPASWHVLTAAATSSRRGSCKGGRPGENEGVREKER